MKIESIRIENLRAFSDETVYFNDYTCMVGPNGSGKSTVLTALNIFFRDTASSSLDLLNLCEEDFHQKDVTKPIKITVTFGELSPEAQNDFKAYFRHGKLVVTAFACWDEKSSAAQVKQSGERLVMADFKEFFKAEKEGALASKLKELYAACKNKYPELASATTKPAMAEALQTYEGAHAELCTLEPSDDQFYGFTRGDNLLKKYIQWIYIPAVKDAASERTESKKSALGQLLELTVRNKMLFTEPLEGLRKETQEKYAQILASQQGKLEDLSGSLSAKFRHWTNNDTRLNLKWQADIANALKINEPLAEVIAGEGHFDGNISRMGHGLQRCFLLALLQELAGSDATAGPKLILGCEEPELYQHPPQARHLASVLQTLGGKNSQIIVSTHSPYFVSGEIFEDVRAIRKCPKTHAARSFSITVERLAAALGTVKEEKPAPTGGMLFKIHQELQPGLNEIFFSSLVVLVEGIEDVAYLTSYLILTKNWDDFRRAGGHIVPANGKSRMIQPLAIMNHFEIPCFAVFDADAHEKDAGKRAAHEKDNKAILSLCNVAKPEPLPAATQWHPNCTMWHTEIGAVVKEDFGKDVWEKSFNKCQALHDANVGDLHKNTLFIGSLMEHTWNQNVKSKSLEKLCDSILDFTELVTGSSDTTLVVKEKKIIREIPGPHDSLAPKT